MIQTIHQKIYTYVLSVVLVISLLLPMISFGQSQGLPSGNTNTPTSSSPVCANLFSGSINTLKDIVDYATCLITKSIVPLLFVIAIAFFIYGVIQYFLNPNSVKDRDVAKRYIKWALLGLFVLVSISGLVEILRNTFGVTGSSIPLLPETQ
jgi:hypothetical protein